MTSEQNLFEQVYGCQSSICFQVDHRLTLDYSDLRVIIFNMDITST